MVQEQATPTVTGREQSLLNEYLLLSNGQRGHYQLDKPSSDNSNVFFAFAKEKIEE
jgi:hypothetical protein